MGLLGAYVSRFWPLMALNIAALLVFGFLVAQEAIRAYPWGPLTVLALAVVNWIVLRRHNPPGTEIPAIGRFRVVRMFIRAVFYTAISIVALIAFARNPSFPLGIQAVVGVLLVGFLWFLVSRIRRFRKRQAQQ